MANALNSGPAAARNTYSPSINTAPVGDPSPVHPGLVGHPLLTPSVQVQILSVIDVTGSASIGDIIAELPGHTDPVGAVFALITADVLAVLSTGFVDANTIVARAGQSGLPTGAEAHAAPADAGPSDGPAAAAAADLSILPANFTDLAADTLPHQLDAVPTSPLQPRIIIGSGERRTAFGRVNCLQRPGVYILLRGRDVYIGYGAEVGFRITDGRQMPGGTPDCIIAIADEQNRLSTDDAKAFERILWSSVAADDDFVLVNGVPDGAAIEPDRYDQLTLFGAQVVLALRQAGLMFLRGSVREHLAGPRTEPDRLGASRRIDDLPEGRVMELSYCGLTALAAEREDGTWLLLRGSDVRIDTMASASASASFQRAAWRHSGLLEPARDSSSYVLKRDIVFSSGSAVSHFVSGSKSFGLSAWQPIDADDEADAPAPAL
ncbi:hypothetical protein [Devosia sp. A369]